MPLAEPGIAAAAPEAQAEHQEQPADTLEEYLREERRDPELDPDQKQKQEQEQPRLQEQEQAPPRTLATTKTLISTIPESSLGGVPQDTQSGAPLRLPATPPGPDGSTGQASRTPSRRASPQATSTSPPKISPFRARTSPSVGRSTNPPLSTARYSAISDSPSGQTGHSRDAPQRKKSTLRSALGRLFGRGRKKNGSNSPDTAPASGRQSGFTTSSQHRSVSAVSFPRFLESEAPETKTAQTCRILPCWLSPEKDHPSVPPRFP